MTFIVRSARSEDLHQLYSLAKQACLLNLPADKKVLQEKLERSIASFHGQLPKDQAEYLFLIEDVESHALAGSSLILAKHGTPRAPHSSFRVLKKNRFSQDLGIGFIHQVLRFCQNTDGPTEIGGLIVDEHYRRRPEKLGRQISLMRFLYMAMYPERFEKKVLCELTPPLTDEGRSEFWEALGRRFTGLPYQEADLLSQQNKEFIRTLFPEEDIYLTLLNSEARLALGRVGTATKPAQHLLEKIGFTYTNEVDPFDGGPHYGADLSEISVVKNARVYQLANIECQQYPYTGLVGLALEEHFIGLQTAYDLRDDQLCLPPSSIRSLNVASGQQIYLSPL